MTTFQFIGSQEQLERFFKQAFKPPDQWQVGMEFEKIGVDTATGRAFPFSGPHGVEDLLKRLAETHGWSPLFEGDRVVGLKRGQSRITLEPGGQLELSEEPHATLHQLAERINGHIRELKAVTDPERNAWIGFGCQPVSEWSEIELLPKARYTIMDRYKPDKGDLWPVMMRATAALQLNLDYKDERDAMEKFRLSMAISPLLTALFANSCISGGRANGFLTRRAYVWQHTDSHRCGFIEKLFHADAGFKDYIDYALDVPMLFVERKGHWVDIGGEVTFRKYMESGYLDYRATWEDWVLHLSTIFTEARFKPYLEVRGADCPPGDLVMAFPAILKGILYDRGARETAWELLGNWSNFQRQALFLKISREGPGTRVQGIPLKERILDILRLSREGLKRQATKNEKGEDETVFLEPLEARLQEGWECPASEVLPLWKGPWKQNVRKLIEFCRF